MALYHLGNDIGETVNLADKMPAKARQLREQLRRWRQRVGAQEMALNPHFDAVKAHWRFKDSPTEEPRVGTQ